MKRRISSRWITVLMLVCVHVYAADPCNRSPSQLPYAISVPFQGPETFCSTSLDQPTKTGVLKTIVNDPEELPDAQSYGVGLVMNPLATDASDAEKQLAHQCQAHLSIHINGKDYGAPPAEAAWWWIKQPQKPLQITLQCQTPLSREVAEIIGKNCEKCATLSNPIYFTQWRDCDPLPRKTQMASERLPMCLVNPDHRSVTIALGGDPMDGCIIPADVILNASGSLDLQITYQKEMTPQLDRPYKLTISPFISSDESQDPQRWACAYQVIPAIKIANIDNRMYLTNFVTLPGGINTTTLQPYGGTGASVLLHIKQLHIYYSVRGPVLNNPCANLPLWVSVYQDSCT